MRKSTKGLSTSTVGLEYPRERARIRGANRRGLVAIHRDNFGEATFQVVTLEKSYDEVREERSIFRSRGGWQDRWWKGQG